VLAAARIMREYRRDPAALAREAQLQTQKGSAEDLLRPPDATPFYADPFALGRDRADGALRALPRLQLAGDGVRIDPQMGELARRVSQSPGLYRALRPEALRTLRYIGNAVRAIAGDAGALRLTSTVRDAQYQRVLAARNIEATHNFSQHTTGYAFDIARDYVSRRQALAFQFVLDRLQVLNVIAWVREPGAIHITAGPGSRRLVM
jgi:hypothetical protein